MQYYVCGFLLNTRLSLVALVHKRHGPDVVRGRMNGIGGKVELGEDPLKGMQREFKEEAGVLVPDWQLFCELRHGQKALIWMYRAHASQHQYANVKAQEDEEITWCEYDRLRRYNVVDNLHWLLPMALDNTILHATVHERAPQ